MKNVLENIEVDMDTIEKYYQESSSKLFSQPSWPELKHMVTACRSDGKPYTSSAVIAGSISPQLIKDAFRMFNKRVDKALKKRRERGYEPKVSDHAQQIYSFVSSIKQP